MASITSELSSFGYTARMPYTPPATHSPGASRSEIPTSSRSQSCKPAQQQDHSLHKAIPRPGLQQSTSAYLHKHRRSPSITKVPSSTEAVSQNGIGGALARRGKHELNGSTAGEISRSLRPTKPVVTATGRMSPPESLRTSSDDETNHGRGRGRDLPNLLELQETIRIIEQHRASSPERMGEKAKQAQITIDLSRVRSDLSNKPFDKKPESSLRSPLSAGARKISHSRSNTDSSALRDFSRNKLGSPSRSQSESDFEEVEDDELRIKPIMVRKKSGELVRPALRPSFSKRRPSSMPGTPTFSKVVHFDPSLEHVRHFLQVDRPIAVSAGSSPVDATLDDEAEFPFSSKARLNPPFEWEIRLTNFPGENSKRTSLPVKVERVYLSSDNKNLMGAIAVQNLAFHKLVVARFTLDYWKTTSEVVADFSNDFRRKDVQDGYDRFVFSIKLEDLAHLENKTLFFCVRYNVNGKEYWDNNNSFNYQVDFSKKPVAQNGKNGMQGNSVRPLQAPRSKSSARPRSMPMSSDDFATCFPPYGFSSHQSSAQMIGDSPLRFRSAQTSKETDRTADVFSQAFGNRYDFSASLSAAIHAGSNTSGDRTSASREFKPSAATAMPFAQQMPIKSSGEDTVQPASDMERSKKARTSCATKPVPDALTGEKPALQSSSYHDLLDKYCFVRSRVG